MKKLLIATTNKAKLEEISEALKHVTDKGIQLVSLKDVNISIDVEETGKTFLDNAQLKAEFYGNLSGLPTLADDGGLMIDALNGEPGVKSRRWPGYEATDEELIKMALTKLHNTPTEMRTAHFRTFLYFYDPTTKAHFYESGEIHGFIAEKATSRPTNGYPYRALFILQENNKFYDELTDEEHHDMNHRIKALRRLSAKIEKYLLE